MIRIIKGKDRVLKRRLKLWAEDKSCHWCGRTTIEAHEEDTKISHINHNLRATLDHLISRAQGRKTLDIQNTVLACHQCNQARNRAESKGYLITILPPTKKNKFPTYVLVHEPGLKEKFLQSQQERENWRKRFNKISA